MNKFYVLTGCFLSICQIASANPLDELIDSYKKTGVSAINSDAGKNIWNKVYTSNELNAERSCTNCHGTNVTKAGEHVRTGKKIDPMAISVNTLRFTDVKKIKKWFLRNCKWTLGRECSAQEQANILAYLNSQ